MSTSPADCVLQQLGGDVEKVFGNEWDCLDKADLNKSNSVTTDQIHCLPVCHGLELQLREQPRT